MRKSAFCLPILLCLATFAARAASFGSPLGDGVFEFPRTAERAAPRSLYPPIREYTSGRLEVGDGHELYFEEAGNPRGIPVVVLHGGPGGGVAPYMRQYFNPKLWRVVLFDQRGAGRSLPFSGLENNDTWKLVGDLEKLRKRLGIEKWALFGGSWGATLALAYGEKHPERVTGMVLRGVFLGRGKELDWLYSEGGASELAPDEWERFLSPIPERERGDLVRAYHKRLTSRDEKTRFDAAVAWARWETAISRLYPDRPGLDRIGEEKKIDAFSRIEAHYMIHDLWLRKNQLLEEADELAGVPAFIVQGRFDNVCPSASAYDLHKRLPRSTLVFVPDAGHSATEPGIAAALVTSTDALARALGAK